MTLVSATYRVPRLTLAPGRNRDGLYDPILADSEREAVADLLQYLENVSSMSVYITVLCLTHALVAGRDGLLLGRTPPRA